MGWCLMLTRAGPTVAQLEVFFSSDYLWIMSSFLCFIMVCYLIRVFLHDDTLHYWDGIHAIWTSLVLQQQQNLGRRFGTSKMHLSQPVAWAGVRSKAVVLLLLTFCLLLLPLWESVIVLCFVVRYLMSILVLQSSWWGRESWLFCFVCLPGVSWWLGGSSLRCHGVVCGLWLWYFQTIITYYF